jgi:hypothetical protein
MPTRAAFLPVAALLMLAPWAASAQSAGDTTVYRCPGPPVLYTDALSPSEAKAKGCRPLEAAPLTVLQSRRPTGDAGAAATAPPNAPAARPTAPDSRVDAGAQRSRDLESRRILEAELRKEEDSLAALQREFNNGEPERRGDERNAQKYLDRIAEMRAAIARKQADVEAIRRELSKLPTS